MSRPPRFGLRTPLSFTEAAFAWIGGCSALWLFAFWSLVLRARLRTGAWPMPTRGPFQLKTIDPKVFPLHRLSVLAGTLVLLFVVPIGIVLLPASLFLPDQRPRRGLWVPLLLLAALIGMSFVSDFMLWFDD